MEDILHRLSCLFDVGLGFKASNVILQKDSPEP